MTDPNVPGQPPAVPPAPPSVPSVPAPPATPPAPDDSSPPDDSELARLRTEAGRLRATIKRLESDVEANRQASMSDQEKAVAAAKAAGAAEWETKWRAARIENAALALLSRHGVTAADLALRAIDLDGVDVDPQGRVDTPTLERAVLDVLKRYPMLAPANQPPIGSVTGGEQRRVTTPVGAKSPTDPDQRNAALRWALSGNSD